MVIVRRDGRSISGEVVNFLSSDEFTYPQLTRLYLDFDFSIVELAAAEEVHDEETSASAHRYVLAYKGENAVESKVVTPDFNSLQTLEGYIKDNVLDILQQTVFETTQIDP